jgi:transposase-like protein
MAGSKQRAPRRRWALSEKRRIVELTLREGASVRAIAHEHGVNRTSLNNWRALYRAGKLDAKLPGTPRVRADVSGVGFLPVSIAPAMRAPRIDRDAGTRGPSIVQLSLASGAMLRIETGVLDVAMLCALIEQLQR